jgi:ketosteroid isomerase-like protein
MRKLVACGLVAIVALMGTALAGIDDNAKVLAKLDDDWSKAAATKDAAKIAAFYADDALAYPPGEGLAKGRAAAQRVWAAYFVNATFAISWSTDHASIDGNLGYTAGTFEDSYKDPSGKLVKETGKYVCVWRKQKDGSWKAIHDIWNFDGR